MSVTVALLLSSQLHDLFFVCVIADVDHEDADRRSTLSMLQLFAETWPEFPQYPVAANACGTILGQAVVPAAKL